MVSPEKLANSLMRTTSQGNQQGGILVRRSQTILCKDGSIPELFGVGNPNGYEASIGTM